MSNANSNGRTFEVYYRDGGHCGPFPNLFQAIRFSIRSIQGRKSLSGCVIRDRKLSHWISGPCNVAVVERNSDDYRKIDVAVLDSDGRDALKSVLDITNEGDCQ